MSSRIVVLDANILIRAVLGNKVRSLIITYVESIDFFTPDISMIEAQKYLPMLLQKRSITVTPALEVLERLKPFLHIVDEKFYKAAESESRLRIKNRDINDWPVVATALILNSPIWTEDQDFFGVGIPTWTTDRIHIFFENALIQ